VNLQQIWDLIGDELILWNVITGKKIRKFPVGKTSVTSVAFSPNGKIFITGDRRGGVKLWDVASGQIVNTLKEKDMRMSSHNIVYSVAFSPDGLYAVAVGDFGAPRLWEVSTGKIVGKFHGGLVFNSVVFSPDGQFILTDGARGTCTLWEIATGKKVIDFGGKSIAEEVSQVALSPDGKFILSRAGKALRLWDITSGQVVRTFKGDHGGDAIAFSPNSKFILSGGEKIKLWDVFTGKEIREFNGGRWSFKRHKKAVTSVIFSPDGKLAMTGSNDNIINLWDVSTGEGHLTLEGFTKWVSSVVFSPDGKFILTGSQKDKIKLWDTETGQMVREFQKESWGQGSVAITPDGKLAVSGDNTMNSGVVTTTDDLHVWDISTGKEIRKLHGHSGNITSVAISPDGRLVVSGSMDNTLKLWDLASGKEIRTFTGHVAPVNSVSFTPNGKYIVSGSSDKSIKVYEVGSGMEMLQMVSFFDGKWLSITPEGYFNASSFDAAKNLNVRSGVHVFGIDQFYEQFYRPDLVQAKLEGDSKGVIAKASRLLSLEKAINKGVPPRLSFITPKTGKAKNKELLVKVCATDQGGGIGRVIYRVNGVTLDIDETKGRGAVPLDDIPAGCTSVFRNQFSLQPGQNEITVTAYNASNEIESNPVTTHVKVAGTTTEKPTLYVLAVGIDAYRDSSLKLTYSVHDAQDMLSELKQQGKRLFKSVEVLPVLDRDATISGISRAFAQIAGQVKANDVFIFYAASHGITVDGIYYMIPQEMVFKNMDSVKKHAINKAQLTKWLASIPATKSLVLLDTCNSGAFINSRGLAEKAAVDKLMRSTGRHTIVASLGTQEALEGYKGHGIFTYTLLKGLAGSADSNGDHQISVTELADYVSDRVPEITKKKWGAEQFPMQSLQGRSFSIGLVQ